MLERPNDAGSQPGKNIRETAVAQVMTSTSVGKHPTALFNTGLPILRVALNVDPMGDILSPLLAPLSEEGHALTVTYAKLLAYKQGNRGLIQYQVTRQPQGNSFLIFGKLYPELAQAQRVYGVMHALWAGVFAHTRGFGIPRPLGCVPDLSMLVYVPAEGRLLHEAIMDAQAPRYMALTAAWLAALHRSRLELDRTFQIKTEVVNLQAWAVLIAHKYPDQAEAAMQISADLQQRAEGLKLVIDGPIHKDFHYAHIVVNDGLNIIDFDEMRYGDPNFDVAHFCANLYLLAYRKEMPGTWFLALQNGFLDAYAREANWGIGNRFKFFYVYTCLKIAKQLCTTRGLRPRPDGEEEHKQVKLMLERGLNVLESGI